MTNAEIRALQRRAEPVHRAAARRRSGASFVRVGATEHFTVECERLLGARGRGLARGVLAACEADYGKIVNWFGDVEPTNPHFTLQVVSGSAGAWHRGCHAKHIFLSAFDDSITDWKYLAWGNVAELVEVFSATTKHGWDCGKSNGEGLSRVLATVAYPAHLDGYETAACWLNSTRRNFVDRNDDSDTHPVSTGCAALFLNYLHHQLGNSWRDIVTNGRRTLGATYTALTGDADGWKRFNAVVSRHCPKGRPVELTKDNIFPLG